MGFREILPASLQEIVQNGLLDTVFEDALAGVEAGRAGHFGFVVGVNRVDQADALKAHGARLVKVSVSPELTEASRCREDSQLWYTTTVASLNALPLSA